ncbi:MAG: FAD-binding oxidoreductase [Bacteroidales bacterium]|nr:FAD-binding oxidoreductase [Bacteroidales bacterium]
MLLINENAGKNIRIVSVSDEIDKLYKVLDVRSLTSDTYVLRIERKNMKFIAGQHVRVRIPDHPQFRLYSIYSGEHDPYIDLLIKEVPTGVYSQLLRKRTRGDLLEVKGPSGSFTLNPQLLKTERYLFIATGTGISPFHSYILSYPDFNYHLLHGVRYSFEAYESNTYPADKITICTSGDDKGHFHGRVTQYLEEKVHSTDYLVYLCGNSAMINDAIDILKGKGFKNDQLFIESYF